MNWKLILKGIGNAAVNGAIGTVAPIGYNWANSVLAGTPMAMPSGGTIGITAGAGAILGLINYFVKSPRQ